MCFASGTHRRAAALCAILTGPLPAGVTAVTAGRAKVVPGSVLASTPPLLHLVAPLRASSLPCFFLNLARASKIIVAMSLELRQPLRFRLDWRQPPMRVRARDLRVHACAFRRAERAWCVGARRP